MKLVKVVIWMNIPSHHQFSFFENLNQEKEIDLEIRYYDKIFTTRKNMGWSEVEELPNYQKYINKSDVFLALNSIPDWKNRIHIVPGFSEVFLKQLLNVLINNDIKWIHWSERSGKSFTKLLGYKYSLIDLLYPLFLNIKGYKKYAKRINKKAIGAFAISNLARQDFIKWGVNKNNIKLLHYALNPLKFVDSNLYKNKKVFMYMGLLTKHKGIEILLEAFHKIKDKQNWILVLVGKDASNEKYVNRVIELELSDSVLFTGVIKSNKINSYISACDVFILPTLFDGWGAVLNEAASLKKPLISTNQSGAAHHLIKNSINGFRVKANSINELQESMQFYIDNPQLIANHGNKSYEIFKEYTPKKNAKLFVKNIYELVNDKVNLN